MGFCLGKDWVVFSFRRGLRRGLRSWKTTEERAGGFFYWLEDDAGEEAAVIGG